jgi:hypothetical protein
LTGPAAVDVAHCDSAVSGGVHRPVDLGCEVVPFAAWAGVVGWGPERVGSGVATAFSVGGEVKDHAVWVGEVLGVTVVVSPGLDGVVDPWVIGGDGDVGEVVDAAVDGFNELRSAAPQRPQVDLTVVFP